MRAQFLDDDDLIRAASGGRLDVQAVYAYCRRRNLSFPDLSNAVSVTIARRFDESLMTYADADAAMNAVWGAIIDFITSVEPDAKLWDPAYEIFRAFDVGEFDHGDGKDPVEHRTRPRIREILAGLKDGQA